MLLLAASDSGKVFFFSVSKYRGGRGEDDCECGMCHSVVSATETGCPSVLQLWEVYSESNWSVAIPWSNQQGLVKIL